MIRVCRLPLADFFSTGCLMVSWKRTFYVAFFAQVLSITGFSFVLPFLPYYIRELGVTSEADVARWAGIVNSAAAVAMIIFAPIWGSLADRYGRKPMVLRSMFSGAVVLAAISFVRGVGQLVVCRLFQGALTGTITASVALVASVTPERRSGYALGMMQSAVFMGFSIGPLLGGVLADHLGFRWSFRIAAGVLLCSGLLVRFMAKENFTPSGRGARDERRSYAEILTAAGFLAAVFALFMIRFSNSAAAPIFPLLVRKMRGTDVGLNTLTGSIFSVAGIAAAISAALLGRVSDAWGHRRTLATFSVLAGLVSLLHAFASNVAQLFVLRGLLGVAAAGMTPSANAIIRGAIHQRDLGRAYGATTSIAAVGWAIGPVTGGYLAASYGLKAPFILTGCSLLLVCGLVLWKIKGRARIEN